MRKLFFTALLIVSIGCLAYPMLVIQPFRHQGETELRLALWLLRWRPYIEVLAVIGAIALFLKSSGNRILAGVATLVICIAAALTRVNVFELMFHPYATPAFVQANDATVDPDDKVLAIVLNGQSRAYPIRTIAYHHIINDEVGGQPVVTTY